MMALDKNITPGTMIRVKCLKANTAGICLGAIGVKTLSGISLRDINDPWTTVATAQINDTLTIIKKPRRVQGVNYCRVETATGIQGEVFWTELRSNCEVV
jgi:hypothetical protein